MYYDFINKIVNEMFKKNYKESDSVSIIDQHWIKRFLNRHPELHKTK